MPLGGWLLAIPLGSALIGVVAAVAWFLRRSRGRRLVPGDKDEPPVPR